MVYLSRQKSLSKEAHLCPKTPADLNQETSILKRPLILDP